MSDSSKPRPKYATILEREPAYLTAIGTLAVEIVNIEIILSELFSAILKVPIEAADAIYFAPKATGPRIAIMQAAIVSLMKDGRLKKEAERYVSKAAQYAGKRNETLHNAWGFWESETAISAQPLPMHGGKPARRVPLSEIQEDIYRVRILAEHIIELTLEIQQTPARPTLRGIPQPPTPAAET